MNRLAILGASGHGKVVADTAELCGWGVIEFFDDAWPSISKNGIWPVVGTSNDLAERFLEFDGVLVAIGSNKTRQQKLSELKSIGAPIPVLVHPSATVSRHATLACGVVVFASAVVNAYASIGEGAILNTGCSVDHDCVIADAVHLSPGVRLAGAVRVGEQSWIGIGACVRQLVHIGSRVTIGAGAAVIANVADDLTMVGVPAQPLRRKPADT